MEWFKDIAGMFIHFDKHLIFVVQNFGAWAYALLFLVVFAETGFVVTPFLPGDSLLFMVGAIAAVGSLNIFAVFIILSLAAILGDSLNYAVGHAIGPRIFKRDNSRFFNKDHLHRAQKFYEKYGAKTIILARFFPIIRTFAPFVAGIGRMNYAKFLIFNVTGGMAWVAIFVAGGFFLGNITFVKNNFALVSLVIIFFSVLPMAVKFLRRRIKASKGP